MARTPDKFYHVNEKTTPKLSGTLKDNDGVAIPSASITTLTAKVLLASTGATITAEQSVLNTNRGTLHSTSGAFTWKPTIAETSLVTATADREEHDVWITWTYNSGAERGDFLWRMSIPNSAGVS